MSNKIYQVYGADEEVPGTTSIYYVSEDYDSVVDYVVGIIKSRNVKLRMSNEPLISATRKARKLDL